MRNAIQDIQKAASAWRPHDYSSKIVPATSLRGAPPKTGWTGRLVHGGQNIIRRKACQGITIGRHIRLLPLDLPYCDKCRGFLVARLLLLARPSCVRHHLGSTPVQIDTVLMTKMVSDNFAVVVPKQSKLREAQTSFSYFRLILTIKLYPPYPQEI